MAASEQPAGTAFHRHTPQPKPARAVTMEIPLALLLEPLDPMRHDMDDMSMLELQDSIRQHGLFENLCVVPVVPHTDPPWIRAFDWQPDTHVAHGGRYRVAAGHRRLLACRAVLLDPVKCEVFVDPSLDEEAIMAGENMMREDPSDYDLAVLYTKWLRIPGMTEERVKRMAGKSLDFIYKRAEILQGYEEVAMALHHRQISYSVARELNACEEPEMVKLFLNMAIDQGATAKLVRGWIMERAGIKAQQGPVQPVSAEAPHVSAPAFVKVECLLCGDTQSYNLRTVMMCGADIERIKAAREQAESAEGSDGSAQTQASDCRE